MRLRTMMLMAAAVALSVSFTAGASAAVPTHFELHHPRRAEVIHRLERQNHRIRDERREGEISPREAHVLHREDRAIFRQEQREARRNGGFISKGEQRQLNREENGVSGQIGR